MKVIHKIIMASAMFGCAYAQNLVSVEAFDEQGNNPSQLTLRLKLTNNTSNTLNDVHAKYFLGFDRNKTLNVSPYYMAGATTSIDTVGDFLVVNINVANLAPGVFPNSSGISLGMNYTDWSAFNKQDNFSYPNANSFAIANNIPVYVNGTIVAGATPVNDPVNEEPPKIRFVGIQPENTATRSAWVELQNYDTTAIDLSGLYLKWSASDSVEIGGGTLSAGQKVRICQSNSLECPTDDKVVLKDHFPVGLEKTITLKKGNAAIDSVVMGLCEHVSYTCLRTVVDSLKSGLFNQYSLGDFFKYVDNVGWNMYSAREINGEPNALPMAKPYILPDTTYVAIENNQKVKLAWNSVNGAKSYVVSVYKKKDNSLVTRQTVQNNLVELNLSAGAYLWNVSSFAENGNQIDSSQTYSANEGNTIYILQMDEHNIKVREKKIVNVTPFAARKDTKLLDPMWGSLLDQKEWNKEHTSHATFDEEESNRCWAVATHMLNNYYGGTMTQDEIKIYGMKYQYPGNGSLYYFIHGEQHGGTAGTTIETMRYLFGETPTMGSGMPSLSTVRTALNRSVPDPILVAISWKNKGNHQTQDDEMPGHMMVIDGYAVLDETIDFDDGNSVAAGSVVYHFLNLDNNGTSYWMTANSFNYDFYLIAENRARVGRTDYRVSYDSDGDGVMDYDEIERFKSNAYNYDSDKDDLNDFKEIYAFVKPCTVKNPEVGCRSFDYLDSDGDKLVTYWDWDSDDGGEKDGSEDARGSNMFNENDDVRTPPPTIDFDLPPDITIYALDAMRVNDRTICHDGEGYCKIASESGRVDFAINIGVQSVVGDIYSQGGVWLRSRSEVDGDIHIYSDVSSVDVHVQGGAVHDGDKRRHNYTEWPFYVWDPTGHYPLNIETDEVMVVSAGQEKTLGNGDKYSKVKVESGGTLKIGPGYIQVGDIQFESGSAITFTNPGRTTVLDAEGNTIWRVTITNEDKELVAKGFKLIQNSDKDINIEGDWAGTIHAARSRLIMGQAKKLMYGRFLAKTITMHQESRIYRVDFSPITQSTNLAMIYQVDFSPIGQSMNLALR